MCAHYLFINNEIKSDLIDLSIVYSYYCHTLQPGLNDQLFHTNTDCLSSLFTVIEVLDGRDNSI